MNLRISAGFMVVLAGLCISSCVKPDKPIALPAKGTSQHSTVDMGEDRLEQFFYNIESGKIVHTSYVNSWDLAFETSPTGYHVFMNGAKTSSIYVYNTHKTSLADVTGPPAGLTQTDWGFDAPCGLPDSTYIGDWRKSGRSMSKNEVYIVRWSPDGLKYVYYKFMIVSMNADNYIISYGYCDNTVTKMMTLPKDNNYNYTYFTFEDGGKIVEMDPPKSTWDIVFTRYRHIYYDYENFPSYPYTVTGVLLNPYNTTACADSVTGYNNIKTDIITSKAFIKDRNVIGFDWKSYDRIAGKYTVNPNKCYIIKTQDEQFWKLHFIDFYSSQGVKGSPSFEYERLQ